MTIEMLIPTWGKRYLAGTLDGDPVAASRLCVSMGNDQRGEAAVVLWQMAIPAPAYRVFLLGAWEHDHRHVLAAADYDASRLRSMFEHAAFDTSALPKTLTVWRGTAGIDRHEAAAGLSWTTSRPMACWFAMRHADQLGRPLVLRLEVHRSEIALFTNGRNEAEAIIFQDADVLPAVDGTPDDWRRHFEAEEARIRQYSELLP
ncbi:hypothetical protein [Halomonas alkalisoli]|uniref:hypothetical protein n=1 Tax=Halomonas alkalisoli TaxID=2907158 RepID=UPI001F2986D0|nr:hypothetical protein [Halomonas alkalisoli]MCE9681957.1 hypothetical protein [Halomonas alkalisoli]